MKKSIHILSLLAISNIFLLAQDASAIVKFDSELIHLGKVVKGEKAHNVFRFTNIGKEDIEIDLVSTCECTVAKWTNGPIKPGESGKINFTFDSTQKDEEVPIDVDIYFLNIDPKSGNPYSTFLQYTYEFTK